MNKILALKRIFSILTTFITALCFSQNIDLSNEWEINSNFVFAEGLDLLVEENISNIPDIKGLIILQNGKIIFEDYYNDSFQQQTYNTFSITKSFTSTLVGQLYDMGEIMHPDSSMSNFFPAMFSDQISYLGDYSLHNALTMSTGYYDWYWANYNTVSTFDLLSMPYAAPGGFYYQGSACHINSHLIYHNSGLTPYNFAQTHLFPFLGIENPYWYHGNDLEINDAAVGLFLNLRDMVKLGQLYLQNGLSIENSNGLQVENQVLSEEWIELSTSQQISTWGVPDLPGYGYLWWIPDTEGVYLAWGAGGQYIAVIPKYNLIIGTHASRFDPQDTRNLRSEILNTIIPFFEISPVINTNIYNNSDNLIITWESHSHPELEYYKIEFSDNPNFLYNHEEIFIDDNYFVFDQNQLENGIEYYFRVTAYTSMGWSDHSDIISGTLEILETDVVNITSNNFSLDQNYPNPFNPITTLRYNLPKASQVNVSVYDMLGNIVKNLVNKNQSSGSKSIQWDATNNEGEVVSAGVYIYMIKAGDFSQTKKMILLK